MSITSDVRLDDLDAELSVLDVSKPECRSTRAAMHAYLDRRLHDRRQHLLEVHLDSCPGCIRAFIDIRQVSWTRRAVAGVVGVAE
ncbi:zf-HC2 domain-containing protein [Promicromonospora sp. Populi]|uniref:zf-HC2 domain-containing protein n=1 Tax=Promicromonospora sp. Populi TaxID=3239420 RepID=UPI0034E268A5